MATTICCYVVSFRRQLTKNHSTQQLPLSTEHWSNTPNNAQYQGDKYSGSIRSQENEYASIQENNYGTAARPTLNYTPVNMHDVIHNERNPRVEHHVIRERDPMRFAEIGQLSSGKEKTVLSIRDQQPPCVVIKNSSPVDNNNRQYCVTTGNFHDERAYSY